MIGWMLLLTAGVPVLERIPEHRMDCVYTFDAFGGALTVEDNAYRLTALDLEILCDGTTRWTLDREAKEVLIEPADPEADPVLLLARYKDNPDRLHILKSSSDGLEADVTLDDGRTVRLTLSQMRFREKGGTADFVFDTASLDASYIVTDLR